MLSCYASGINTIDIQCSIVLQLYSIYCRLLIGYWRLGDYPVNAAVLPQSLTPIPC